MIPRFLSSLQCSVLSLLILTVAAVPGWAGDATVGTAKRGSAKFFKLHAEFLERANQGPVGLLFLGDSITEGWKKVPELWEASYGHYQPANFGIGGDRTEHVIWRIEQGELEKMAPKVTVLMIGTNNTGDNAAVEIAAANRKIISMIQAALPETKVLLLGIFPRGPRMARGMGDDWEGKMAKISAVNADMAQLDDGDRVRYLDISNNFLAADGSIPMEIMPDQLHPNALGYQIWVDAMAPLLAEMMK
jgi:lysophospholipase L1-like esterase